MNWTKLVKSRLKRQIGKVRKTKLPKKNHLKRIRAQQSQGRSAATAFLHIPKTGGSAIGNYLNTLSNQGHVTPLKFSHAWTLGAIASRFPDTMVSFMLRDPLERTVSAFNSRLRQGRPRHNNNWRHGEAISFSMFPGVEEFLRACTRDDDYSISAVTFAFKNITHLYHGYAFYFESPEFVRNNAHRLGPIGDLDNSLEYWKELSRVCGVPEEVAEKSFRYKHVASVSSAKILENFSTRETQAIKKVLAAEYEIYHALKNL